MRDADNRILKEPDIVLFGGAEKLENTSVEELAARGLRKFEMPELIAGRKGSALTVSVEGHPRAYLELLAESLARLLSTRYLLELSRRELGTSYCPKA
ncbi:hypothetical protein BH11CYA1_BH11CYA1_16210 [soil metagenome]